MKKTKIVGCLSSAFVALMILASCQGVVKNKGHIVLSYNGKDYTAEELFADQKSSAAYDAKFNAVLKVAVRQWAATEGSKYKEEIENNTKVKISGQKSVAQSNADKNGTSYDTEWNKILTSNGVEDESQLYDKFEYDYQKEKFDDDFYENKFDILKNGGDLYAKGEDKITVTGYLPKKQPYHVKHILVKVGAAEKDYRTGEITEDQAIKLSRVIKRLARGDDFSVVAKDESEDTGSATKGGDLGIMDRDTSFVNEFKLGTYMFESFYLNNTQTATPDGKYATKKAEEEIFGKEDSKAKTYANELKTLKDPTTMNGTNGTGLGVLPLEAALMLGKEDYYDDTATTTKTKKGIADVDYTSAGLASIGITDNAAKFYPRNVIFNKYFNKRNIMVIGNRRVQNIAANTIVGTNTNSYILREGTGTETKAKRIIKQEQYVVDNGGAFYKDSSKAINYSNNFKSAAAADKAFKNEDYVTNNANLNGTSILTDNEGRPIFVFRSGTSGDGSYQGIHFVVIERSPFIGYEIENGHTGAKPEDKVSLPEYFTKYYPGQITTGEGYPTYTDGTDKKTYVNYISGEAKDYKDRADAVKSKVKGYDSNINTYIYQYLVKTGSIKFNGELGEKISKEIDESITRKRQDAEYSAKNTWNNTWETYYMNLEEQTKQREQYNIGGSDTAADWINGIIPEACAVAYADWKNNKGTGITEADMQLLFKAGGAFHE